ncbi:lasso peptide biosynthesis B2 protein [Sphingomonas sp. S2-65]|uniref:lasso peptide biosynthesis B2 protein n=1 Tax=Sphingomonas sp. S2-65 TaxID=2903960 RepID=UPI001F168792|nr:lasso peptide biosynthesis B2 protein [Sphingomonas sp. S2-65]UYY57175.1 lasso peptide biosynthesis B2 protein [Sphingomonas sp. S2-65]
MSIVLRSGLSWCTPAGQTVFLDLTRDRYFCLSETPDALFRRWAAGEALAPPEQAMLVANGVAEMGEGDPPAPAEHVPATRDHAVSNGSRRSVPEVTAAIIGQLGARRWLRRLPLSTVVARLAQTPGVEVGARDETCLRKIAGAFVASAMVVRAADQCLPRAIAAQRLCRRQGQDAALIFGVRLDPFAAHSWVQAGDAVVVGDLEQVRLYTPILVVR